MTKIEELRKKRDKAKAAVERQREAYSEAEEVYCKLGEKLRDAIALLDDIEGELDCAEDEAREEDA